MNKFIKRMKSFLNRITIKIFIVILTLILPMNVFIVLLNNYVMKYTQEEFSKSMNSILETYMTMLEHRMSIGSNLLWQMMNENENGIALLNASDNTHYILYKSIFFYDIYDIVLLTDGLDSYFFCVEARDDILIWNKSSNKYSEVEDYIQTQYENDSWDKGWELKSIDGKEILCLYVEQNEVSYGGWIELNDVRKLLEHDIQYENKVITFTSEEGEEEKGTIRISSSSGKCDFSINAYFDSREVQGGIISSNLYILMGTVASLFVFPFLYLLIHKLLLVPLETLNIALKKAETGDLDYRITKKANSEEFAHSFRAYNAMIEHIQRLKIENYEKQLEKERMELVNLQLQIRPHFLLNSFNLIHTLAQRNENHSIQEIILYLSGYFRYLFRSGRSLELYQKEQELLEGYIKMAQVRYPESIEIEYDYDPEIMFVRVPPLLMHNFVENIVKHVVKIGTVTHISIIGQYEDKNVTFMILDDGQGMPEQKVRELDEAMRRMTVDGAHVGFANSLKRIKYFYGDSADIMIASAEGEGTCITITFPYNLEETT